MNVLFGGLPAATQESELGVKVPPAPPSLKLMLSTVVSAAPIDTVNAAVATPAVVASDDGETEKSFAPLARIVRGVVAPVLGSVMVSVPAVAGAV